MNILLKKNVINQNLEFTADDKEYILLFNKYIGNGTSAEVHLFNMYVKQLNETIFVKQIVIKDFIDDDGYNDEIEIALLLKKRIQDENFEKHILLYYDNDNKCILYNYLGTKIDNHMISKLCLKEKLIIMKQLIDQAIILSDNNFIHNDIKPENIVCETDKNGKLTNIYMIDYGLIYEYPHDYLRCSILNTTVWSGSPEYLMIAKIISQNKENRKQGLVDSVEDINDMLFKSQYYALAGIMIGLLMNDIYFHFNNIHELVKTDEEIDMIERFKNYDERTINIYQQMIKRELNKNKLNYNSYIYHYLKNIIFNMLEYEYKKRFSLKKISSRIQDLISKMM